MKEGNLSIVDISGNLLSSMENIQDSELSLDLGLNQGIYVVKLENKQKETLIKRIVIQ